MNIHQNISDLNQLTLVRFPIPAKVLVTAIILIMGIALFGALGQVIVHDIIPTFFSEEVSEMSNKPRKEVSVEGKIERGDLFRDLTRTEKKKTEKKLYENEQFIWLLKWTHIHLFGMNIIFIFVGAITFFLDMSSRARTWLIVSPFIGVLVDISAMWLKTYKSQLFFWLHIPGGGLFLGIFVFITIRALMELWVWVDDRGMNR